MRDRLLIFSGLALFVFFVTWPVWHGVAARTSAAGPKLELPKLEKNCVAPREYMRTSHMSLLINWRENAVRNNQLRYRAYNGKTYDVSLSRTCLGQCHGTREKFCDRCHSYAAVSGPYCWNCHNDIPKGVTTPGATSSGVVAKLTGSAP